MSNKYPITLNDGVQLRQNIPQDGVFAFEYTINASSTPTNFEVVHNIRDASQTTPPILTLIKIYSNLLNMPFLQDVFTIAVIIRKGDTKENFLPTCDTYTYGTGLSETSSLYRKLTEEFGAPPQISSTNANHIDFTTRSLEYAAGDIFISELRFYLKDELLLIGQSGGVIIPQ